MPDFFGPLDIKPSGVFATYPKQSLILLIDFKKDPEATWDRLYSHLTYFRDKKYLTHFNSTGVSKGLLTIIVSGRAPFNQLVENPHYRDVFYDAPLGLMASLAVSTSTTTASNSVFEADDTALSAVQDSQPYPQNPAVYSPANSYYASVSFVKSIGYPWHSSLSQTQLDFLRKQISGAHSRGLKVRYWGGTRLADRAAELPVARAGERGCGLSECRRRRRGDEG